MKLMLHILILTSAAPGVAVAESTNGSLRLGADVGGRYTTNVYRNASQLADMLGLAGVSIDGDWTPSPDVILKLDYHGDLEMYQDLTREGHYGHNLGLTSGFRPTDTVYLSITAGGEHAWYPKGGQSGQATATYDPSLYTFWGLFGRAKARWEVGDASTLEAGYRLRSDQFPDYDLDNVAHRGKARWSTAVGDHLELEVPATYEASFFQERYLLDSNGDPTSDKRRTQHIEVEPAVTILPTFDLELIVGLSGELNLSDDTYYYDGPFGAVNPTVPPELIRHFDSFWGVAMRLEARWLTLNDLTLHGIAAVGYRGFPDRPAYDALGLNTGEKEQDIIVETGTEIEYRLFDVLSAMLRYGYLRQISNDALWDFDRHRVELRIGTWWESDWSDGT